VRDAEQEAARTRMAARAGECLEAVLQHNLGGTRITEVRLQTEGGARAFCVVKGVRKGVPVIGFRSLEDVISGMADLWGAVKEDKITWKNDEYPNKLQKLLSD